MSQPTPGEFWLPFPRVIAEGQLDDPTPPGWPLWRTTYLCTTLPVRMLSKWPWISCCGDYWQQAELRTHGACRIMMMMMMMTDLWKKEKWCLSMWTACSTIDVLLLQRRPSQVSWFWRWPSSSSCSLSTGCASATKARTFSTTRRLSSPTRNARRLGTPRHWWQIRSSTPSWRRVDDDEWLRSIYRVSKAEFLKAQHGWFHLVLCSFELVFLD